MCEFTPSLFFKSSPIFHIFNIKKGAAVLDNNYCLKGGHVAQLDRAAVSGTVGRGFESYRDHHPQKRVSATRPGRFTNKK